MEENANNIPIIQNIIHVLGDAFSREWDGIVDSDGVPIDMSTSTLKMQVRKNQLRTEIITLEDTEPWIKEVGKISIILPALTGEIRGKYQYDIESTLTGFKKTLFTGEFLIIEDSTK